MVTTIQKLDKPYEVIFEQLGEYKDGKEMLPAKDDNSWDGALEGYKLEAQGDGTLLQGYVDTDEQYEAMMANGFQKGFEELAQMAAR